MRGKKEMSFSMLQAATPSLVIGPLLREVISAQRADEQALDYPRLRGYAAALARRCRELENPLVWPVGDAAERLAGAAILLSEGSVRVRGWSDVPRGERVLVLTVAAVTPVSLMEAARHARALGAAEIHACGVEVAGVESVGTDAAFDSYDVLYDETRDTATGWLNGYSAACSTS
jgi:hypothetical protein